METLIQYLPFLIPLVIAELVLMVVAVLHIVRHPRYRFGNRMMWILIAVLVQIIGPVCYFAFGREREL